MSRNSAEEEKAIQIGTAGQSVIGESSPFVDSSGKTENQVGLGLKASPIVPADQVSYDGVLSDIQRQVWFTDNSFQK